MEVKILGTGCANCVATADLITRTAQQLGVTVKVEKVTDPAAIASYGAMGAPGVVIDGKVVHAGGVPKASDVEGWLQKKAAAKMGGCCGSHGGCCG